MRNGTFIISESDNVLEKFTMASRSRIGSVREASLNDKTVSTRHSLIQNGNWNNRKIQCKKPCMVEMKTLGWILLSAE